MQAQGLVLDNAADRNVTDQRPFANDTTRAYLDIFSWNAYEPASCTPPCASDAMLLPLTDRIVRRIVRH
jgi:hypothetical protein